MLPDKIYIVGFMGSGKTTAGKKLSSILGWTFIDLDKKIEQKTGKTISRIFSEHGEDYFRKVESESLRDLERLTGAVVSTGGGAPCHDNNMDFMLASGITVYLKLTPEQLRSRLTGSKTERPLIKGLDKEELLKFIKERLPQREKYYCLAQIIVEGLDQDVRVLAEKVRERI